MLALAIACAVGVVALAVLLADWISLRWTIVAILGVGVLFAIHMMWTSRTRPFVDACVRCGRATPEGIFCAFCGVQREVDAVRVLDDLSLEISGGATTVMVPYGTRLPFTTSEVFSTADDDQRSVGIHLVTGTSVTPLRRTIAKLTAELARRRPRAIPKVSVTVTIDESGDLEVEVSEVGTSNSVRSRGYSVPVAKPPAGSRVDAN